MKQFLNQKRTWGWLVLLMVGMLLLQCRSEKKDAGPDDRDKDEAKAEPEEVKNQSAPLGKWETVDPAAPKEFVPLDGPGMHYPQSIETKVRIKAKLMNTKVPMIRGVYLLCTKGNPVLPPVEKDSIIVRGLMQQAERTPSKKPDEIQSTTLVPPYYHLSDGELLEERRTKNGKEQEHWRPICIE